MSLVVLASVALAAPTPPPDPWLEERRRSDGPDLYAAGMYTGLAGAGAIVIGLSAAVAMLVADESGGNADAALGVAVAGTLVGIVAIEVGAPVALVGARQERRASRPGERGGTTAADVGWACYAGQILFGPLLVGAYVGAGVQHMNNGPHPGPSAGLVPGVGVQARF